MALRNWVINSNTSNLFSKLQNNKDGISDDEVLFRSIKYNLQNIFNATPGECHASVDLGIIDINNPLFDGDDIRAKICDSIEYNVLQYENRINHVEFKFRSDIPVFLQEFLLIAYLKSCYGVEKFEFDIVVDSSHLRIL